MNEYIIPVATLFVSILVAVIGAIPGVRAIRAQKDVRQSEADLLKQEITESVLELAKEGMASCQDKIVELEEKIKHVEEENQKLRSENARLRARLRKLENNNKE
jgi:Tfp pilus assembly protein PilN